MELPDVWRKYSRVPLLFYDVSLCALLEPLAFHSVYQSVMDRFSFGDHAHFWPSFAFLALGGLLATYVIYNVWFHPLASIPGPFLGRFCKSPRYVIYSVLTFG